MKHTFYKIAICLILVFVQHRTMAQNKIHDLKISLEKEKNEKEQIDLLLELSNQYLYSNSDSSKYFANKAYAKAQKIKYHKGITAALNDLGYAFKVNGELDTAMVIFKKGLKLSKDDKSLQSTFLTGMAGVLKDKGDAKGAIKLYNKCITLDQELNDTIGIAKDYGNIAIAYEGAGNYDSSIFYTKKQIKIYEDIKSPDLDYPYNNIGVTYYYKGDYEKSVEYFIKALKVREEKKDTFLMAASMGNISALFSAMGNYTKSIEYGFKSLDIFTKMEDKRMISRSYSNIASNFENMEKYDTAIYYNKIALEVIEPVGDIQQKSVIFNNMGNIYLMKKEYQLALKYLNESRKIKEEIGDVNRLATTYNNIGRCYLFMGENHQSLEYLNKALLLALQNDVKVQQRDIHLSLSEAYSNLGNYKMAYLNHRKYHNLNDSLVGLEKTKQIEELETIYETELKDKTIAEQELHIEKEKLEADLAISKRNRWLLILSLSIVFVLILAFLLIQRNRLRSKAKHDEALLKEREKGLKAIFNATEEERKRIAKDLHDGIGQQISGLKMMLFQFKSRVPDEQFEKFNKQLEETGTEVRNISHQMMPQALQNLGLVAAIEDMLEKSFYGNSTKYNFEHLGLENRLSEEIEIAIYRICQELINNSIKHSNATKVDIQLFIRNQFLFLIVEDNGVGMNTEKESGGIGMLNMKSRLDTLNGNIEFDENKESGTLATIRIKL